MRRSRCFILSPNRRASRAAHYFVGVQGGGLFYLDPYHSRPAIPLRPFIDPATTAHPSTAPDDRRSLTPEACARTGR
ncbi:hypothetical protein FB451DRAFT_1283438 [Mycena latifolia]|nr:hypothetical protein FB451DRAFT_1283438 [Mycena latifolia]